MSDDNGGAERIDDMLVVWVKNKAVNDLACEGFR
jgi:hypothetical protein